MDGIKERSIPLLSWLVEALAWWVFAHAILVGVALLLMAAEKLGADVNAIYLSLIPLGEYFRSFRDEARVIAFP